MTTDEEASQYAHDVISEIDLTQTVELYTGLFKIVRQGYIDGYQRGKRDRDSVSDYPVPQITSEYEAANVFQDKQWT